MCFRIIMTLWLIINDLHWFQHSTVECEKPLNDNLQQGFGQKSATGASTYKYHEVTQNGLQLPFFFFSCSFSSLLLDRLPKVFLGTSSHFLPRKRVTKIGLHWTHENNFLWKLCLKLLFETGVAHNILCALQKVIMVEISGHIQ